jgi:hypothetical protein
MKKLARAAAVIAAVGAAGVSLAVNPATFNITVNMTGGLSVAIVSGAPVVLGSLAASAIVGNPGGVAVVVQNDSLGLVEDYQLSVANSGGGWTIGAAQAPNVATLHAAFNSILMATGPALGDFAVNDQLTGGAAAVLCGISPAGPFAGPTTGDGQDVLPAENNSLWIRFGAPTGDLTGGAAQSFTVTINAVAP